MMTSTKYRPTARAIHWTMAVIVLATIPAGLVMVQEGISRSLQDTLFLFHKNVGVLLLLLIIVRILYRLKNPPAPLPAEMPDWQVKIAGLTHLGLYTLLFLMPIAGYVRVKAGGFPIESLDAMGIPSLVPRSDALADAAKAFHYFGGLTIAALVAAHIGAACFHGIIKKDGVFSRMWPPVGGDTR